MIFKFVNFLLKNLFQISLVCLHILFHTRVSGFHFTESYQRSPIEDFSTLLLLPLLFLVTPLCPFPSYFVLHFCCLSAFSFPAFRQHFLLYGESIKPKYADTVCDNVLYVITFASVLSKPEWRIRAHRILQ